MPVSPFGLMPRSGKTEERGATINFPLPTDRLRIDRPIY